MLAVVVRNIRVYVFPPEKGPQGEERGGEYLFILIGKERRRRKREKSYKNRRRNRFLARLIPMFFSFYREIFFLLLWGPVTLLPSTDFPFMSISADRLVPRKFPARMEHFR